MGKRISGDINDPKVQLEIEAEAKRIYKGLEALRKTPGYREYIEVLENLMEQTRDRAIITENLEDIKILQVYHKFLNDLINAAHVGDEPEVVTPNESEESDTE